MKKYYRCELFKKSDFLVSKPEDRDDYDSEIDYDECLKTKAFGSHKFAFWNAYSNWLNISADRGYNLHSVVPWDEDQVLVILEKEVQ